MATASSDERLSDYRREWLEYRFWAKVQKGPACWEWTGARNRQGYGWFSLDSRAQIAHRVSWLLNRGAIPSGLYVCHSCDNPPCVNPAHLWLGTQLDNRRDCSAKGRTGPRPNRKATR